MARLGQTFTHLSVLDPDWRPGPGQKYKDGPKAVMQITRMTSGTVYYGYRSTGGGGYCMDRATFEARYPEPERRAA